MRIRKKVKLNSSLLNSIIILTSATLLSVNFCLAAPATTTAESYGGRTLLVYFPGKLPARGARSLVIVLHGGLGNASRIVHGLSETGLNMNGVAEKNGFIVAYLNGTPVTRRFSAALLGWNAGGGCCGVPAANDVDDVGYVTHAV
jgi:polyhydroxybutyrate depolymerase